jgi:hypothetical protein
MKMYLLDATFEDHSKGPVPNEVLLAVLKVADALHGWYQDAESDAPSSTAKNKLLFDISCAA